MNPVEQTVFGKGGNSLAACVASILDLADVEDVPNFMESRNWYRSLVFWLEKFGYTAVRLSLEDDAPNQVWNAYVPPLTPVIWAGPLYHCCVGQWDGKLLHDPHPDQEFHGDKKAVDVILLLKLP